MNVHLSPGDKWFGYVVPDVDKGNLLHYGGEQYEYIEKIFETQTRYYTVMKLASDIFLPNTILNLIYLIGTKMFLSKLEKLVSGIRETEYFKE